MEHKKQNNLPIVGPPYTQLLWRILYQCTTQEQVKMNQENKRKRCEEGREIQ